MIEETTFRVYGSGPPLVLIPGFAAKANSWGFQYRWLKRYFTVITVEIKELCTMGLTKGDCDISALVDDISEILTSSGVSKTALVGSSMGAMLALEYARKHPEKISNLILVSLPFNFSPFLQRLSENMNSFIQDSADNDSSFKKLLPVFFSPVYVNQHRFKIFTDFFMQNGTSFSQDVLFAQLRAAREWLKSKRWMGGCQCPCLFIYGSEDQLISKETRDRELASVFSNSEVNIIEGAGHSVHIEKYREFNGIIDKFLTR